LAIGLLSLCVFAACLGAAHAQRPSNVAALRGATAAQPFSPDARRGASRESLQEDGAFDSLEQALRSPERVRRLAIQSADPGMRHLPAGLGTLVNLEALELSCLENLEDLPEEIGELRKLKELVIDNGNGCSMNVSLPRSIGRLANLRVLRLYGALDGRDVGAADSARAGRSKLLPESLGELRNLEELDLGRNGIRSVPPQVASLRGLKKLSLDYNEIREVPAFVGGLKNLQELSLNANGGARLPQTLSTVKGLKVFMGNNRLTLSEQKSLRARFPGAVFSFENEYDDAAANQEPPKPRARRGRRE
jgi:Leucine-rich repeat (LRR) protein